MNEDVSSWITRRTTTLGSVPAAGRLLDAKGATTVDLIIPALNEEATIGRIVTCVLEDPTASALVDDLVVIDGGSADDTCAVAEAAGARVLRAADIAPDRPLGGKGGSLWRALQATSGDLVTLVDADLDPFDPAMVTALLAPLLLEPDVHLVKAAAERPLLVGQVLHPRSGARVTELMARPLLNALWPELAGLEQPLSGELAARRSLLERLPIATGYGLEIAMLIDTLELLGLDAVAQVEVGERRHRNQSDLALSRMASAVLRTALARRGLDDLPDGYVQFGVDDEDHRIPVRTSLPLQDLPPVASLTEVRG